MSVAAFRGEEDASDALSGVPPDRRTKLTGQETLTPELLRKRRSRARRHCFRGGKARSQAVVAAQALMVPQQLPHSQAVVAAQALVVPQQLPHSQAVVAAQALMVPQQLPLPHVRPDKRSIQGGSTSLFHH